MLTHKQTVGILVGLSCVAFIGFLIPFIVVHKGLPTGDSQKSIVWAQYLLDHGRLPKYDLAITILNRDPVDFYTPFLHILTAVFLKVGGLWGIGVSAIIFTILTAAIGAVITYHLFPSEQKNLGSILTLILILTQERFLRYVREPGYHYQNIIGELILFTLILLGVYLVERWRWSVFALACVLVSILAFSHQFSTFLAVFLSIPFILALTTKYKRFAIAALPIIIVGIVGAYALGLQSKIPSIFTSTPHLLSQTPTILRTLDIMGTAWMITGLTGAVLLIPIARKNLSLAAFLGSVAILLLLSQGPRLGIDIPPVRALFYLAVPLSITGAFLLTKFSQTSKLGAALISIFVILFAGQSTTAAFTLSHSVRTNSTLTPGDLALVNVLKSEEGEGVLVDDYDRRSASWLVLSGHPMFTRIAADLQTQMREAHQSPLRYQLYLNQLDYEKILALGSLPEIAELMNKQHITWITGIEGSSESSLAHNPALEKIAKQDDITLFMLSERSRENFAGPVLAGQQNSARLEVSRTIDWLLKPSTLTNDIGDLEDTLPHLPIHLSTTRLSAPEIHDRITSRSTTAPLIPIMFNVGSYVQTLWDQDQNNVPDSSLEFLAKFTGASSLTFTTGNGKEETVRSGEPVKIAGKDILIDSDGFITLVLNNPQETSITFDVIALGLAHTP